MTTQDADSNYDTDSDSDDTDSTETSSHEQETILLEQLDKLLGQYYSPKNRKDYFDENGKGRFRQICEQELIDYDDEIEEELKKDMEDSELAYEDFCENIMKYTPYYSSTETYDEGRSQKEQWWYMIQYLYQYRQLPPHSVPFISWRNISDAVKHQMYSAIGTKMVEVIGDIEESETG